MSDLATTLFYDRRVALITQTQKAASRSNLLAVFAAYWAGDGLDIQASSTTAIARAAQSMGAARTYRELAILGFAFALGEKSPSILTSFQTGLKQLMGRAFEVGGMHAPVCDDSAALTGLTLGILAVSDDQENRAWVREACQIGLSRHQLANWDRSILELLSAVVQRGSISDVVIESVMIAAISRGLVESTRLTEDISRQFLTKLKADATISDEEAVLSLAALEWLLRASPVIDLASPSIHGVCKILDRVAVSLYRWVFEDTGKTKGATPRQWHIDNEYHVQSMLWSILAPVFPELKEEEWLSSIGQKKPRADLCLPGLQLIIEVKFIRMGTKVQDVIEQIAADTGLYLTDASPFSSIVVFIWDDTASTDQHHVLSQGLKSLNGVVDVIIQSRPSRFGLGISRKQAVVKK